MPLRKQYEAICESCDTRDIDAPNRRRAVKAFRSNGWYIDGDFVLCPQCRQRHKAEAQKSSINTTIGGKSMTYKVFHRTWWTLNKSHPDGREPFTGRKTTICKSVATQDEARSICATWNAAHKPGFLSRKAEFEEIRASV